MFRKYFLLNNCSKSFSLNYCLWTTSIFKFIAMKIWSCAGKMKNNYCSKWTHLKKPEQETLLLYQIIKAFNSIRIFESNEIVLPSNLKIYITMTLRYCQYIHGNFQSSRWNILEHKILCQLQHMSERQLIERGNYYFLSGTSLILINNAVLKSMEIMSSPLKFYKSNLMFGIEMLRSVDSFW